MILILGGAHMGKATWAAAKYGLRAEDFCDLRQGFVPHKRCYCHLEAIDELPPFPEDAIVIARELGSGIVPMDADLRQKRERHGAHLQILARQADRVVRIFCGLAEVLK